MGKLTEDEYENVSTRYQLFREGFELTKPKGTKRKMDYNDNNDNDDNGDNKSNNHKDDKNDKINDDSSTNNTKKDDPTSTQSQMNQPSGSGTVSKKPCARSNNKKDDNSNVQQYQQKHVKNENEHEETIAERDDENQFVQKLDTDTAESTEFVELPKRRRPPLTNYCTQKCLLSLKNNSPMDKQCPNYSLHAKDSFEDLHPIKYGELAKLFLEQINNNTDSIQPINSRYGVVGYMTKITVYPYGYTIVGKGQPFIYENDNDGMKHEVSIYKHLDDLQGEWIPVFLGFIDLGYYCYILLSYGGENPETYEDFNHETVWKIEERLRDRGVRHNDVRLENIVLNKEVGHEMLIDFHMSYFKKLEEKKKEKEKQKQNSVKNNGDKKIKKKKGKEKQKENSGKNNNGNTDKKNEKEKKKQKDNSGKNNGGNSDKNKDKNSDDNTDDFSDETYEEISFENEG